MSAVEGRQRAGQGRAGTFGVAPSKRNLGELIDLMLFALYSTGSIPEISAEYQFKFHPYSIYLRPISTF